MSRTTALGLALLLTAGPSAVADLDGAWQSTFAPGANGPIHAATIFEGELVVGGEFTWIGGVDADGVARWDGTTWHQVGFGISGRVNALLPHDGQLYAGGSFSQAGPFSANNVARWSGASWIPLSNGLNDDVLALASWDGDVVAAGAFRSVGPGPGGALTHLRIARWNGLAWTEIGGGLDATAHSVHARDGILYVGGAFQDAGGVAVNRIASWDGSSWGTMANGVTSGIPFGLPAGVEAIVDWEDGIAVTGNFNTAGQVLARNVATWNGSAWKTLGGGVGGGPEPIRGFAIEPFRSHLVVAGRFLDADGSPASRIAAWDGSAWSTLGQGLSGEGFMLESLGRELVVGGAFSTAGGIASPRIASWLAPPAPSGAVPDGSIVPGTPLTMRKLGGSSAALDWGESCSDSDVDYAVYAGALGDFTSHAPVICSTGGVKTWTLPIAADAYYLVVPTSEDSEGGYGFDGDGIDRPASTAACAVQSLAGCATP